MAALALFDVALWSIVIACIAVVVLCAALIADTRTVRGWRPPKAPPKAGPRSVNPATVREWREPPDLASPLFFGSLAKEPEPPVLTDAVCVHKKWSDV